MNRILNESEMYLIETLNNMYTTNFTQISRLQDSNDVILNTIQSILDQPLNRNTTSTQNIRNTRNSQNSTRQRYTLRDSVNPRQPDTIEDILIEYIYTTPTTTGSEIRPRSRELTNDRIYNIIESLFTPIVISPTSTQIENATRRALFRDIVNPNNESCPIRFERFNDDEMVTVIRHCGHIFNGDSLNQWFQNNVRCPVCRFDIRESTETNSI